MSFPQAAREAGLRAWINVLRERHPNVTWVARGDMALPDDLSTPRVDRLPTDIVSEAEPTYEPA